MKLKSLIMFSAAALAFAACSNDEDFKGNNGGVEGLANVSVKISEPTLSRAISAGDFTTTTQVTLNSIKLVLTAQTGGGEVEFNSATYADEDNPRQAMLDAVEAYQFEGVRNPSKMEVYINNADETKTSEQNPYPWATSDLLNVELAEPMYAASTTFTDKGDIETPEKDGINEYEVVLEPEHTMARLEFGGIKHIHTMVGDPATAKPCMFKTINIDGVTLDGVTGMDISGWDATDELSYVVADAQKDFNASNAVWPADGQCIAYNIAPVVEGTLPILKVCFSGITINTDVEDYNGIIWPEDGLGYATVKNYKLANESAQYATAFGVDGDGNITKFPAGYIYQVKSLEIPDEKIGHGWDGNEDIHVYAVVTVKPYVLVEGTVEWN